jgi:redox-sensitive bicupin YhaK (pirin superfamily)
LYMIDGVVFISGIKLTKKDTIFIWNTSNFYIIADKKSDFIIFELPLKLK